MKTLQRILVLLILNILYSNLIIAQSNITKLEYFFDNDPGYGLATNVSISAGINIANFNIPVNPATLTVGIHNFNVRAKDALGNWSLLNSTIFYKPYTTVAPPTLGSITKLEYFVDNDPGYGLATNIAITSSTNIANLIIPINPAILSVGVHTIVLRARDANGNWSLQNSTILYKPYIPVTSPTQPNITKVEYFVDIDPGYGLATNIAITSSTNIANLIIPINPANLSVGVHTIIIRARDANGNWSLQNSTILYKPYIPVTSPTQPNITKVEYFIDNDPGYGLATNVSITSSMNVANLVIPINPATLSVGMHSFVVRARDANGNWSLMNTKLFYKPYSTTSVATSNIVKVEYYFDYDPGYGNGKNVAITPSTNLSNLVIPIDPLPLSVCAHNFYVRAKDANGNWSLINATPVNIPLTISVKMFIEGYYAGNDLMTKVLENQGVQSGPCEEVDSVTVELHNVVSPYALAYSYKGVLRTDGILPCKFPNSVNGLPFYIVVRSRNGLQTWSTNPVTMSQSTSYDFSTNANKAYGNNMIQIDSTLWAIYSGDLNNDENIDLLDMSIVEADINNFQFGYYATDINGDGNADLLDVPIIEANINNFIFSNHP